MKNTVREKTGSSLGWVVIAASTLIMTGFFGTEIAFSVFLKPLVAEFSWTRAQVAAGMSILQLAGGLVGIITGVLADRYGARLLIVAGGIAGGLGYLLLSRTEALWELYLYFGVVVGISLACIWVPVTALVSTRFPQKRVLALGITTAGINLGQMTIPPLIAYYVVAEGWRYAYLVMAVILGVTSIPTALFLGRKKPTVGPWRNMTPEGTPDGAPPVQPREWSAREAARTVPFWMLVVCSFVIAAGYYFVITHIVAYGTDIIPGTTSAALVLTFLGGTSTFSKVAISWVTARIGSRGALLLIFGLQALGLFLLMRASSLGLLFAGGAIFGLGFGGASPVRTALVPELFGVRAVATIIGLVSVAWAAGGVAGPVLAGYVFDISQSYQVAFLTGIVLMMIGIVATYFLKIPKAEGF
ncbi:MAG: MFS transporter [Chloroflexi bacterium]|nr:MFS transporter [Chloroflexota bacterium]